MVDHCLNSFDSRSTLTVGGQSYEIFRLDALERAGVGGVSRLPFSIKILLENMLRGENGRSVQKGDIEALARWNPAGNAEKELAFTPARVLMQDLTGVPAVVGKFVEFYGPGLSGLRLADRATLGNMGPEYGATIGFFPVDQETLRYHRLTGRDDALVRLVEAYTKAQGSFRTDNTPDPLFSDSLELDLGTVESSLAGPRRPQDRVSLRQSKRAFRRSRLSMLEKQTVGLNQDALKRWAEEGAQGAGVDAQALGPLAQSVPVQVNGDRCELRHGSVVIAAITSCTNTSNPAVIIGAGHNISGGEGATDRHCRQGVWLRVLTRLGGQRPDAARGESGHRPKL